MFPFPRAASINTDIKYTPHPAAKSVAAGLLQWRRVFLFNLKNPVSLY